MYYVEITCVDRYITEIHRLSLNLVIVRWLWIELSLLIFDSFLLNLGNNMKFQFALSNFVRMYIEGWNFMCRYVKFEFIYGPLIFSSPELKAQVSYSDRPLSVVRLSVRPSVRLSVNFYIFDFFSRTTGPILTRLGTNHPWGRRY
jgi:hypothetical protein